MDVQEIEFMKFISIILLCFCLLGCKNESVSLGNDTLTKVEEIMQQGNYIILDVRTKEEYHESHLIEAQNIPYDEIDETVALDKEKTIFVYCKSGVRSKKAYDTLKRLGYTVYDLGAYDSISLPKE